MKNNYNYYSVLQQDVQFTTSNTQHKVTQQKLFENISSGKTLDNKPEKFIPPSTSNNNEYNTIATKDNNNKNVLQPEKTNNTTTNHNLKTPTHLKSDRKLICDKEYLLNNKAPKV